MENNPCLFVQMGPNTRPAALDGFAKVRFHEVSDLGTGLILGTVAAFVSANTEIYIYTYIHM